MSGLYGYIKPFLPSATAVGVLVVSLYLANYLFDRSHADAKGHRIRRQVLLIGLFLTGLLAVLLTLPLSEGLRGQLVSLLGILLSATIALSSTTLVGNAMAGFMLRSLRSFRLGDFVQIGEHFGRVSERGLFHVEIQTEDRDLTTLPNLYLVTQPFRVLRSSGTVISATVSLGYEHHWSKAENLLLKACQVAELEDPFVQVLELGDFSITYRAAGLLRDVKQVLSVRSRLREHMLDALHGGGIEIVSPTFMNQRAQSPDVQCVPKRWEQERPVAVGVIEAPERKIFDKAEQAETLEKLREYLARNTEEVAETRQLVDDAANELERSSRQQKLEKLEEQARRLAAAIKLKEKTEGSRHSD